VGPPFPAPPPEPARTLRQEVRLELLRAAALRYGRTAPQQTARNALLIRPDHLGDLLLMTPAVRALREAHPDARLTLLVGPWNETLARALPELDGVQTCPFPGFARSPRDSLLAPYRLLHQEARRLRREGFDSAVILRFDHWWGAWLAAEAGIPRRIGYDRPETRPFLTEALPYAADVHEAQQNARLLEVLAPGLQDGLGPTRYPVSAADGAWANDWLAAQGADSRRPLAAIHPGAGAAVKQWPIERWAAVARRLADAAGAQILVTGGPGERALADAFIAATELPVLDAAGKTSVGQLGALLARCDVVLGSDSGPLHLAVAVGAPTVHLYGPVDADRFGPWGAPDRHVIIRSGWPCVPCNRLDWAPDELPAHACMVAITVEQVSRAAESLLRLATAPPQRRGEDEIHIMRPSW
jgi:heptosyltransferase-2/heptosyltransferase-3